MKTIESQTMTQDAFINHNNTATRAAPDGGDRYWAAEHERLHGRLQALWSAPVRDFVAIDAVMKQLDEAHAAYKARQNPGNDPQRF